MKPLKPLIALKLLKPMSLVLSFVIFLTSCYTYVQREPGEARVDRAMHLMDEGRFDEAIAELKIVQEQNPSEKNSQLLASAFAGRAGLRVEDYWDFVVGFKPWKDLEVSEELPVSLFELQKLKETFGDKLSDEDRKKFLKLQEEFKELARLRKRVETIPSVSKEKRSDLTEGLRILSAAETRGGRLYRAILGLVILKSSFEDGVTLATRWQSENFVVCSRTFPDLMDWVGTSFDGLQQILGDLGKAFPNEQSEMLDWQEQLKAHDQNIKSLKDLSEFSKRSLCE
jgi:hypothetical protein